MKTKQIVKYLIGANLLLIAAFSVVKFGGVEQNGNQLRLTVFLPSFFIEEKVTPRTKKIVSESAMVAYLADEGEEKEAFPKNAPKKIEEEKVIDDFEILEKASKIENHSDLCKIPSLGEEEKSYKAEMLTPNFTREVKAGDYFWIQAKIKNTGNTPWFSDDSNCKNVSVTRLGTSRTIDRKSVFGWTSEVLEKNDLIHNNWVNDSFNRVKMDQKRVNPGEIATFSFWNQAPENETIFREYFSPVIDGVTWMKNDEATTKIDVYIGDYPSEERNKIEFTDRSLKASDLWGPKNIEIDLTNQRAKIKFGDVVSKIYRTSTGAKETPTPTGEFKVHFKQWVRVGHAAPHYIMPRYMSLASNGAFGFHALPQLKTDGGRFWEEALSHIGTAVSHGCIRLLPTDADEMFAWMEDGVKVNIHY